MKFEVWIWILDVGVWSCGVREFGSCGVWELGSLWEASMLGRGDGKLGSREVWNRKLGSLVWSWSWQLGVGVGGWELGVWSTELGSWRSGDVGKLGVRS